MQTQAAHLSLEVSNRCESVRLGFKSIDIFIQIKAGGCLAYFSLNSASKDIYFVYNNLMHINEAHT